MPEILYGLDVAEYRHPADLAAQNAVEKAVLVNKLGESLEKFEHDYQDQIIFLGTHMRLTSKDAPHIVGLLEQAKETLDYQGELRLFTGRNYSFCIEAGGGTSPLILVPDAVIRQFPDSWMLFLFGQAVTMIKGRMQKMFQLSNGYGALTNMIPLAGKVLKAPLGQWMRKVQLTIDRGGLLACQDYDTVMRYLTVMAGIPMKDVASVDMDARMEQLQRAETEEKDFAENWGHIGETIFNGRRAWSNERFIEMYHWYTSGEYGKIIQTHT